jgi:hypothetical protein
VLHHSAVEAGGLHIVDEKGWQRGDCMMAGCDRSI